MDIIDLIEEKALGYYGYKAPIDSLELDDRVSGAFLAEFDRSFEDDHSAAGDPNRFPLPVDRASYWESQQTLLQEVLERYNLTGLKLREEIKRAITSVKESEYCSCMKPNYDDCTSCFRQGVVNFLCQKGFNASLCKSKWNNTKKYPGGKHEYIEVIASTGRKKHIPYVIELEFREQFEIAKACNEYAKLIAQLPEYYIGKLDYLNAIVGIICDAAKTSMKERKIHMGPWRKRSFIQMKWSSSSSNLEFSSSQPHQSCLRLPLSSPAMIAI